MHRLLDFCSQSWLFVPFFLPGARQRRKRQANGPFFLLILSNTPAILFFLPIREYFLIFLHNFPFVDKAMPLPYNEEEMTGTEKS